MQQQRQHKWIIVPNAHPCTTYRHIYTLQPNRMPYKLANVPTRHTYAFTERKCVRTSFWSDFLSISWGQPVYCKLYFPLLSLFDRFFSCFCCCWRCCLRTIVFRMRHATAFYIGYDSFPSSLIAFPIQFSFKMLKTWACDCLYSFFFFFSAWSTYCMFP